MKKNYFLVSRVARDLLRELSKSDELYYIFPPPTSWVVFCTEKRLIEGRVKDYCEIIVEQEALRPAHIIL